LSAAVVALAISCPTAAQDSAQEISTQSVPVTFHSSSREVLVRVVVRDHEGQTIPGLTGSDFAVFDNGVSQKLTSFREESALHEVLSTKAGTARNNSAALPATIVPGQFTAYVFDDLHAGNAELLRVRDAAVRHFNATLTAGDRAAIFTASGQVMVDFTDDRAALEDALGRIRSRPLSDEGETQCPWMSYYMADLIVHRDDQTALQTAARQVMVCESLTPEFMLQALYQARMKAYRVLATGDAESRTMLDMLRQAIQRLSVAPGHRMLVLASPGFIVTQDFRLNVSSAIDRAVRADVVVNTLDVRGLAVDADNDASRSQQPDRVLRQYIRDSAAAEADLLVELADGTGGARFHNSNDLDLGFRRTAATPDHSYLLAFSPQGLKSDGSFHPLQVRLSRPGKLEVQARKGYYAPGKVSDAAQEAYQEIEDALFSREELSGIPIDVRTEFFKSSENSAQLTVLSRVQVHRLPFDKKDGINHDDVTVVAAVFDHNGRYVSGEEKRIELHMHDSFLETVARTGILVRSSFEIQPGGYLVRVVVRDAEGKLLSASNGAVDIP
jgi:VWFA-related protein